VQGCFDVTIGPLVTLWNVNGAQEFQVSLGVQSAGQSRFAGDETFHGQMALRYADGDRAGDLAASAEVISLEALKNRDDRFLCPTADQTSPAASDRAATRWRISSP
jgi:hypothetical protein